MQAISWPPSVAGKVKYVTNYVMWTHNFFSLDFVKIYKFLGVLIGLMQVVIVLGVGDTLGGSSSYVTIVSQWVVTEKLQSLFPYLAKARKGVGNWWQVDIIW